MGACCSGNDSLPQLRAARNMDNRSMKTPLIEACNNDNSTSYNMEGLHIRTDEIISYILQISTFDLIAIWEKVDIDNRLYIEIESELQNIFLCIIDDYIEMQSEHTTTTEDSDITENASNKLKNIRISLVAESVYITEQKRRRMAKELFIHFVSILKSYNYTDIKMERDFFLQYLQQYLAAPYPDPGLYIY